MARATNIFVKRVLDPQCEQWRRPEEPIGVARADQCRRGIQVYADAHVPLPLHPRREQGLVQGNQSVLILDPGSNLVFVVKPVITGINVDRLGQLASALASIQGYRYCIKTDYKRT